MVLAACAGTSNSSVQTSEPIHVAFPSAAPLPYPALASRPGCIPRTAPVMPRLSLVASRAIDARITELTVRSQALGTTAGVDVMVPAGYDPSASRRYPVLYLLHGHGGSHRDWPSHGVEGLVGSAPLMVVMPDGGYDGFYSDWYGSDADGHTPNPPPGWESFHIRELIPFIDATYRTLASRSARAVAGESMGGFGAMSYAARHPDLFAAAGSFSGIVDTDLDPPKGAAIVALANITDGHPADRCIFGDPQTQDIVWRDHDPTELARNFGGVSLYLASGNGRPVPPDTGVDAGEQILLQMNQAFDSALTAASLAHITDLYGAGTHAWRFWERDLQRFLPQMMATFANPPPSPPAAGFSYQSAAADFGVFGWRLRTDSGATVFTYLDDVGAGGFTARGSGVLHVSTPGLYRPLATYRIHATGMTDTAVTADSAGLLRFDVRLGPPAAAAQTQFGPDMGPPAAVRVDIAPA